MRLTTKTNIASKKNEVSNSENGNMYKTGTTTPMCAMSHIYFLLPAYNEEENLPGLLQAIDESVENYRIILVDDGSSDRTGRIAREFASKIPITILTHNKNEGMAAALNTGWKRVTILL
jgi:cellulose synthase/poly-beta-1,6-N-acetylglucosamine synthase-like glycosyltransferase